MALRNIIRIDESLCNGCGNCVTGCHEGALAVIDGKARLVRESHCDGLGACIGTCPTGALTIERREADAFDEAAVATAMATAAAAAPRPAGMAVHGGGCPGSAPRSFPARDGGGCPGTMPRQMRPATASEAAANVTPSELTHWPIQLHLIHPLAPQFHGAHLLVAADCTAFAFGAFHPELLRGKALVIACPKLDDDEGYLEKLTDLFAEAAPASVTVARMEVPCCGGLVRLVVAARDRAASPVKVEELVVGVEGGIVGHRTL